MCFSGEPIPGRYKSKRELINERRSNVAGRNDHSTRSDQHQHQPTRLGTPVQTKSTTPRRRQLEGNRTEPEPIGGGNGQKSKTARERNAEKNKAPKGSQLEANKKAMNIQCKVCIQTFICTTSEAKCKEHAEARHPKNDLFQCLPHRKN